MFTPPTSDIVWLRKRRHPQLPTFSEPDNVGSWGPTFSEPENVGPIFYEPENVGPTFYDPTVGDNFRRLRNNVCYRFLSKYFLRVICGLG